MHKQLGGKITPVYLEQYARSVNWKKGSFQNFEETAAMPPLSKTPGIIYKMMKGHALPRPARPLPVLPLDPAAFMANDPGLSFVWYGHSALLVRMQGKNILVDPMLGPDTAPVGPFRSPRFSPNTLSLIDDLPEIDLMLLTHDHYDHLDMASMLKLRSKVKQYYVALGVKRHLVSWGVPGDIITEFDWWDSASFADAQIHFTPSRHFSGRGLRDRAKSLWGGWVLDTGKEKVWISGDSGYGDHFKTIGDRFGGFDFAFIECGQYGADWPWIHMFPHQCIDAANDAGVRRAMPVHWAAFMLSYQHAWYEPVELFCHYARENGIPYLTPPMGKVFTMNSNDKNAWWEPFK